MIGNAANIRSLISELDKIAAPAQAREMQRILAFARTKDPISRNPRVQLPLLVQPVRCGDLQLRLTSRPPILSLPASTGGRALHRVSSLPGTLHTRARRPYLGSVRHRLRRHRRTRTRRTKTRPDLPRHASPARKDKWFNAGPVALGKRALSCPKRASTATSLAATPRAIRA